MVVIRKIWSVLWHPLRTSREIALEDSLSPAFILVIIFAVLLGAAYFITFFLKTYPPPPAEMQVWIDTWGQSFMMPFLPIPLESYRLFMSIAVVPGIIILWLGMAAIGSLFSKLFKGKSTFKQYLEIFGFSFFPFWIIAAILDFLYMGFVNPYIVPALQLAYGPLIRTLVYLVPLVMYPVLLGLGGVYNGLATYAVEGFSAWKCILVGCVTGVLAIAILSMIVR
jgi:hypothetical protein